MDRGGYGPGASRRRAQCRPEGRRTQCFLV